MIKRIEIRVRDKHAPIGSIPTKRYKVDVRQVDNFAEALEEFGGMLGILNALNERLEQHGMNTFRIAKHNGVSTVKAKKLARTRKIEAPISRKKQHQIIDKFSSEDMNKMSPEDIKKMLREIGGFTV